MLYEIIKRHCKDDDFNVALYANIMLETLWSDQFDGYFIEKKEFFNEISEQGFKKLIKTKRNCSRSKFLSKIFKINVKNFREIFPDFTHRKRGSDFITVPFLSSGSHALRLPSAFPFSVPCLEYTLSVLQQSSLTPHISGLYALLSN